MSPMMIKLRFLHAFSGRHPFPASFPKMMRVGKYVTVDGHVIDVFASVHSSTRGAETISIGYLDMIRPISVMATRSARARTMCRPEPMSSTSNQISLPLPKSSSNSKVLSAMDSCFPAIDFRPDEDGIIDLTTPENDALYEVVKAHCRSGAGL